MAAARGTRLEAYVTLSLLTGVRTEEVRALRWDHVVAWVSGQWSPVPDAGFDHQQLAVFVWRDDEPAKCVAVVSALSSSAPFPGCGFKRVSCRRYVAAVWGGEEVGQDVGQTALLQNGLVHARGQHASQGRIPVGRYLVGGASA